MKRRTLLIGASGTAAVLATSYWVISNNTLQIASGSDSMQADDISEDEYPKLAKDWTEFAPVGQSFPDPSDKLTLSKEDWRYRLDAAAFDVLRNEGTERPFTSALDNVKDTGVFVCAGCDLPLFTSAMKFDSGTGWPSFVTKIDGHLETSRDFKLILPRTEYHCIRCGGHQGHIFNDGPKPTGQRWCNNGVALKFVPKNSA
jgi:peptide-methionine (R)-S-oxide reductase